MPTSLCTTFLLWITVFMLAACSQSPAPQDVTDPVIIQLQAATGGEVIAWGSNTFGQTTVPVFSHLSNTYTAVAAGSSHSVGLRSDGQIVVWGNPDPWGYWGNYQGIANVPPLPSDMVYTAVAAGGLHSLALRSDGGAVAWGYNSDGQTVVPALPAGVTYTAVAGGEYHSLALRSDGQVVAWGSNAFGQTVVPTLPAGVHYTAVAGGRNHSLALRSDGEVVGWGHNGYGEINVPALPAGVRYTAVAGGSGYSLALRSDGQVVSWGSSSGGLNEVPTLPAGVHYTAVAAGSFHSLALRSDGEVVAWGSNSSGQTTVPALPAGVKYTAVAGGGNHSLALTDRPPKQDQTLSFTSAAPTDARVGGSATVSATSTSGLAVTISSSTPDVCTVSGSTVSFIVVGTCTVAANQAGNDSFNPASEVTQSFAVLAPADTTAPVITPSITGTLGENGWYISDVTVSWTVGDDESEVSAKTGCGPITLDSDTNGISLTCEATSSGGTSSASVTLKRDATAPSLGPAVTPNPVLLNGSATVTSNASDITSGVASQNCGAVDTGSVGGKSVTCTATDNAGNTSSADASYKVVYGFEGFLPPVDNTNLNLVKAGRLIPLKWRLTDANGASVTNLTAVQVSVTSLSCPSGTSTDTIEEDAAGSSGLQNLGEGYYQFNWQTPKSYATSCKTMQLDLGEGIHRTARFSFTR